jgi:hypothetical protein
MHQSAIIQWYVNRSSEGIFQLRHMLLPLKTYSMRMLEEEMVRSMNAPMMKEKKATMMKAM